MVDIESATAEIIGEEKDRRKKKKPQGKNTRYNVRICYAGRP